MNNVKFSYLESSPLTCVFLPADGKNRLTLGGIYKTPGGYVEYQLGVPG